MANHGDEVKSASAPQAKKAFFYHNFEMLSSSGGINCVP